MSEALLDNSGRHWLADDLYSMPLHSTLRVSANTAVLRVAGGWVYRFEGSASVAFVPFDNEFQSAQFSSDTSKGESK